MVVQQSRPSARTWVLAAIELIAAIAVARLIVASDNTSGAHHHTGPRGRGGIWTVFAVTTAVAYSALLGALERLN